MSLSEEYWVAPSRGIPVRMLFHWRPRKHILASDRAAVGRVEVWMMSRHCDADIVRLTEEVTWYIGVRFDFDEG